MGYLGGVRMNQDNLNQQGDTARVTSNLYLKKIPHNPYYTISLPYANRWRSAPDTEPFQDCAPLPESGVEIEQDRAGNYKIRLTIEIAPELISATKAKDRSVMIQVALSEKVKAAARQIIGKLAIERLKKSYGEKQGLKHEFCGKPGCVICNT